MIPLSHGTYTRTAREQQPQIQPLLLLLLLLLLLRYDQQRRNLRSCREKDKKVNVQSSVRNPYLPLEIFESRNDGSKDKSDASSLGSVLQPSHKGYDNENEFRAVWNKNVTRRQFGRQYHHAEEDRVIHYNTTQLYKWI